MCLKYIPNTTRGMKPKIINLINEMEMKNAAYAADLFAIEKNGLNQAFKIQKYDSYDIDIIGSFIGITLYIIWPIQYDPYRMVHIMWSISYGQAF